MALQEYFIDEKSRARSNEVFSAIIEARDITPVFNLEKDTVIHVCQEEIDRTTDRRFCYQALLEDGSYTPLLIEYGRRYLNSEIADIVFRDNLFPVSLTWKTRNSNKNTIIFIFYDDNAYLRFTGDGWQPVGPASFIDIENESDGVAASYLVNYNHYTLNATLNCEYYDNVLNFKESFGLDWLASTLNFRADYLEKQQTMD